jgi:hypothetical protein
METIIELGIGAVLFALGYRGFTGRWPWQSRTS